MDILVIYLRTVDQAMRRGPPLPTEFLDLYEDMCFQVTSTRAH